MPQVIGVWCREEGHDVTFVCYSGFEDLLEELPSNVDLAFIAAFTEAAHTAYALSNLFRSKGAITAIGGPHARCYPEVGGDLPSRLLDSEADGAGHERRA